jgi:transposase
VKTKEQQAAGGLHKVREMLVKQRTMLMNQLRGLMAEFGIVVPQGPRHIRELVLILEDPTDQRVPELLKQGLLLTARSLQSVQAQEDAIDKQIVAWGRSNPTCRHLITIDGYGPILSSAMAAIVTAPEVFASGRDFSASLGLVPRQSSTGGKTVLGPISKRGNGYLRRLLVNGATSVLNSKRAKQDPWLVKLLKTKKRKVAAVALANKMARIGWAVMMRQEDFRPRQVTA